MIIVDMIKGEVNSAITADVVISTHSKYEGAYFFPIILDYSDKNIILINSKFNIFYYLRVQELHVKSEKYNDRTKIFSSRHIINVVNIL